MKRTGIGISLLLSVVTVLASCAANINSDALNKSNNSMPVFAKTEIREVNGMKREFCEVESLQKTNFTLKNTVDELYHIDNSFLEDFKVGDKVLLLYLDRTSLSDGGYSADVYAIYPDDDTLLQPAK